MHATSRNSHQPRAPPAAGRSTSLLGLRRRRRVAGSLPGGVRSPARKVQGPGLPPNFASRRPIVARTPLPSHIRGTLRPRTDAHLQSATASERGPAVRDRTHAHLHPRAAGHARRRGPCCSRWSPALPRRRRPRRAAVRRRPAGRTRGRPLITPMRTGTTPYGRRRRTTR